MEILTHLAAFWVGFLFPQYGFLLSCPLISDSKTNGLESPLENPLLMLKPTGTSERKNKWQGQDGFILPIGAVLEGVQELGQLGRTSAEVSRTSAQ